MPKSSAIGSESISTFKSVSMPVHAASLLEVESARPDAQSMHSAAAEAGSGGKAGQQLRLLELCSCIGPH